MAVLFLVALLAIGSSAVQGTTYSVEPNTDYQGYDIPGETGAFPSGSATNCADTCLANPICVAYVYINNFCYNKDAVGNKATLNGATGGLMPFPPAVTTAQGSYTVEPGYDYAGNDISGATVPCGPDVPGCKTIQDCAMRCLDNSACVVYHYYRGAGQCQLKNAVGTRGFLGGSTSGIVTRSVVPTSGSCCSKVDATCTDVAEDQCQGPLKTFKPGGKCSTTSCPVCKYTCNTPTTTSSGQDGWHNGRKLLTYGACCSKIDTSCEQKLIDDCNSPYNTFLGQGSSCSQCPPPSCRFTCDSEPPTCPTTCKIGKANGKCKAGPPSGDYFGVEGYGCCPNEKCYVPFGFRCADPNGPCKDGNCKCYPTSNGGGCPNVLQPYNAGIDGNGYGCEEKFCNAIFKDAACCPFDCTDKKDDKEG